jgi:hypothetical protein
MDGDIKQQIKELLLKENITMTDLVERLNNLKSNEENKTTLVSLNNKLTRGSIKYSEILEIFNALNYDIILQKRSEQSPESSYSGDVTKSYKPVVIGAVTGMATGGLWGSFIGGILGNSWSKSGTTTGGKDNEHKNIITSHDVMKNAKEFEKINGYNPIPTDDDLYEMELQQDRLDLEHDVEVNIQAILDYIVLNCDTSVKKKYKDLIDDYILIKDLPVAFKLTSMYRVVFKLLSVQSDASLRSFISELRNLYVHGGLMDINDDELMKLFEVSRYYRELLTDKNND